MELAFILAILLLISFSILGFFDGVYLHLYKYKLHVHSESRFEHYTHTLRSVFFIGILYFLYLGIENNMFFYIGLAFVLLDLVVLFIDAYVEKDSRKFMGGLPRWEYIIHLFVNGFHFAGIAVLLILKIDIDQNGISLNTGLSRAINFNSFKLTALNILPGAILVSILHVVLLFPKPALFFNKIKFSCC